MSDNNNRQNGSGSPDSPPLTRRKMRQRLGEPTDAFNIRAAISDINAFIEFCEVNRYTYGQGFKELVRLIPRVS